jgi:hypothetical protein
MVAFMTLWNSYPADQYPCSKNNVPQFENQCAIRLGVCFQTAGVSTDHWPVARCWHHPRKDGHTIRAEDLARFFGGGTVAGLGQTEKYDGKVAFPKILTRTGVVFIKDWWGPGMTGDHIDLWNSNTMKTGITVPYSYRPGDGWRYEDGKIWFWQVW